MLRKGGFPMAKMRKMLGDVRSRECADMMALIETQSKATLAAWAVDYARRYYLPVYVMACPGDGRLEDVIRACVDYLQGTRKLAEVKPLLREAAQIAREAGEDPVAQAAARAISTACATVQTPTNALGFLFYGAAAVAYGEAGLNEPAEAYDALASKEFRRALADLRDAAVPDEPNPAKINWNC